ncbi:MAG: flagellar motor protein MotB [Bacillaceae bacterium]|nr:flagellar motor protein MotB [Bacillaceae bacterium]
MERKSSKKQPKGAPKWMVTFSDLMTLILVFFVLLFSMSVVDAAKFQAIAESFQQRGVFDFSPSMIPFDNPSDSKDVQRDPFEDIGKGDNSDRELNRLLEEVNDYLERNDLTDMISAARDDRGVVLVLQERALFDSGEADILPGAEPFLRKVGTLLQTIPNMVKVEGHTDSRPINTFRYPSNWELSGARASSVIRFLIDENELSANRFIAVGYGDTRPVVPNTTVENLQKNRRVIIVISDPSFNEQDTF